MRRGIGHAVRPYPVKGIPTGRRLNLPGRGETFITDSGRPDGPVIFLLHSVSTTGLLCWYPVIPELERDYRVITMDHRLHGRGIASDDFVLDDCADDVVAVADALGIDRFVAAGFSMGGGIAQLAWQRSRDRVAGLVLCSTGPYFSSIEPNRLALEQRIGRALTVVDKVLPTPPERVLDDPTSHPLKWGLAQVSSTPLGLQGVFAEAMARFDSRSWLGEVDVPTAVVVSTHDKIVQPERQQLLVDGIPGAQRFDVAGGHACCVIGAEKFVPVFADAVATVSRQSLVV
ncbi:alpha/beta hydrolase fold protein [Gordonia neofelifaecis NRRL B-59395]|uniref:Alpha/beta hydrolase fold protein n=2 Tax=Gordonia TaxID=2053 RepID=F1YLZ8_9ACTN|nr:alpha/beta hydrolase fold protein [Gordonia neofelifaecis NRRL B-59395]